MIYGGVYGSGMEWMAGTFWNAKKRSLALMVVFTFAATNTTKRLEYTQPIKCLPHCVPFVMISLGTCSLAFLNKITLMFWN